MNIRKLKLTTLIALGLVSAGLTACNTIEGAGRDLEAGGEAVQDAADDAR